MGSGWKVDVAGSEAIVRDAARAGSTMQDAAAHVDAALRAVVAALTGTEVTGAAQGFFDARQGDATRAVRAVQSAIAAATAAMNAFAEADGAMSGHADAASARGSGRSIG